MQKRFRIAETLLKREERIAGLNTDFRFTTGVGIYPSTQDFLLIRVSTGICFSSVAQCCLSLLCPCPLSVLKSLTITVKLRILFTPGRTTMFYIRVGGFNAQFQLLAAASCRHRPWKVVVMVQASRCLTSQVWGLLCIVSGGDSGPPAVCHFLTKCTPPPMPTPLLCSEPASCLGASTYL